MPRPLVSGIASLLVPGLGQILNKKYLRGALLLGAWFLTSLVVMVASMFLVVIVHLLFIVSSAVDAYRVAKSAPPGI